MPFIGNRGREEHEGRPLDDFDTREGEVGDGEVSNQGRRSGAWQGALAPAEVVEWRRRLYARHVDAARRWLVHRKTGGGAKPAAMAAPCFSVDRGRRRTVGAMIL